MAMADEKVVVAPLVPPDDPDFCPTCAPFACDDPDRHLGVPSEYTPLRNRGCHCGADLDGRDCMCFEDLPGDGRYRSATSDGTGPGGAPAGSSWSERKPRR